MRRTFARITITAAATVGLVATSHVQALGLGEIDVSSNLNQRFVASIPLTEINAEDLETVTVTLAPNDAFERAGIDRAEYLSSLNFEIKNDKGRPRVVVTSGELAREPVLNLLVQARWSGGKIVRDYTVLLDPPQSIASAAARAAPSQAPAPVAQPAIQLVPKPATRPTPVIAAPPATASVPVGSEFYETPTESKQPARKPAAASPAPAATYDSSYDSATASYGPVAPKETLWSIAGKVRPSPAVSMDQVLLALAEANPVAIQRGTTVSQGVTLRVPSAERMQAISPAAAKTRLASLRAGGHVSAAAPAVKSSKPAAEAATKPVDEAAPKPATPATQPSTAKPAPVIAAAPPATAPPKTEAAATAIPKTQAPATNAAAPAAEIAPPKGPGALTESAATTSAAATPAAEAPTAAGTAATAAAEPAPATSAAPAPTPAKSPLAQPLPEEPSNGFIDAFGLPLAAFLGLLVLIAGLLLVRRRKAATADKGQMHFKPGDTSSVHAPLGGSGAVGRFGDTGQLGDTQSLSQPKPYMAPSVDATQKIAPASLGLAAAAGSAPHESTLILDPEAAAALTGGAKGSAAMGGQSFDKTTQLQMDTSQIDLGDNDPLSEAEFHLAYGLYDEAILLLKTAEQKQPQRSDLKIKLAETYFAAGRPMEFLEASENLKDKVTPGEWSKIAIMGAQICPDVALFQGDSGADAGLDADFDLAFDVPESTLPPIAAPAAAESNSVDFSLSLLPLTPVSAPMSAPSPKPMTLDFPSSSKMSLDDDLDHKGDSPLSSSLPPAGLDDEASIDFMLGQSLTPLGAGLKVPDASDLSFNLGSPALNLESAKGIGSQSLGLSERATLTPGGPVSFSLQDLEVSITPRQQSNETPDDELNTKLDLARAYVEMGDNDMARGLLQEVQQLGGDRHKQEAAGLLQRLPK